MNTIAHWLDFGLTAAAMSVVCTNFKLQPWPRAMNKWGVAAILYELSMIPWIFWKFLL